MFQGSWLESCWTKSHYFGIPTTIFDYSGNPDIHGTDRTVIVMKISSCLTFTRTANSKCA